MKDTVIWIGCVLFLASSLFLVRSSYEMFVLTPLNGPQMIFFSLIHTWPDKVITLFFVSWYAYYAFVLFAAVFAITRLSVRFTPVGRWIANVESGDKVSLSSQGFAGFISRICGPPGYLWSVLIYGSAVMVVSHFTAAMTYDHWSWALFQPRV